MSHYQLAKMTSYRNSYDQLVNRNKTLNDCIKTFIDYKTIVDQIVNKYHYNLDIDECEKYNELRVKVEKSVRLVDGLVATEESAPDERIVIKRLPDSGQRPYGKCRYISVVDIGLSLQQMNQIIVPMSPIQLMKVKVQEVKTRETMSSSKLLN